MHNIWEFYKVFIQALLVTIKTELDILHKNVVYELSHELPNDLILY